MMDHRSDRKTVRLELSNAGYRQLQVIAEEDDWTETEALREAVMEYLDRKYSIDPDDPFFTVHDRVVVPAGDLTTPAETDDDRYR